MQRRVAPHVKRFALYASLFYLFKSIFFILALHPKKKFFFVFLLKWLAATFLIPLNFTALGDWENKNIFLFKC